MPTTRPRHILTETDELARAIDSAAVRWPEDRERRARLLVHLVEAGHDALNRELKLAVERRRAVVLRHAGALAGAYEPGYLENLRADWPE
jgi:hypothetical protein